MSTPVATRRRLVGWRPDLATGVALVLVAMFGVLAVFAPLIAPYSPTQIFPEAVLTAPSDAHWFGTDANGMDVFSRTVYAARLDLGITVTGVAGAVLGGILLGTVLGYVGGWADVLALRVLDTLQAVPLLILALAILAATRGSAATVAGVIAFVYTPILTRVVRTEVIALKNAPFVEAARAVGNGHLRIMYRHILPNALGPVIVQGAIRLAFAIKVTAALAFVGVGILPPTAEWGGMIRLGTGDMLNGLWWTSFFPGVAVTVLVLAVTLLADGLQAYLNPKTRQR